MKVVNGPIPDRLYLSGQRFGRLLVISSGTPSPVGYWYLCRCECGSNPKWIRSRALTCAREPTRSCGCLKVEWYRRAATVHGAAGSKRTDKQKAMYEAWRNMTQRCFNQAHPSFKHYGGRGILTCSAWSFSFALFWRDMQSTWFSGSTLERLDNEDGYYAGNCAWRDQKAQLANRRPNGNGKHAGEEPF